jgi:hypothetical protein
MKYIPLFRLSLFLLLSLQFILIQYVVAGDDTLRCRGRLAVIGDSASDVLNKCGEPDEVEQWKENNHSYISQIYDYELERYILPKLIKGPILVEQWTYNFGSNRLIRYLHFENGKLIKIETGDKVCE